MEEKCSLCARSEISSTGTARARIAAIKQQTADKTITRLRRILPPLKSCYTNRDSSGRWRRAALLTLSSGIRNSYAARQLTPRSRVAAGLRAQTQRFSGNASVARLVALKTLRPDVAADP